MGCDIHLVVERMGRYEDEWVLVPEPLRTCWCCKGSGRVVNDSTKTEAECHYCHGEGSKTQPWYDGRNYKLFTLLAGVRNYHETTPLAEPRGVPEDTSDLYRGMVARWDGDGHSHSWFTVEELLKADWDRVEMEKGLVSPWPYAVWAAQLKQGRPPEWCGGASGEHVSNEKMEAWLVANPPPSDVVEQYKHRAFLKGQPFGPHTPCEWKVTPREYAGDFLDTLNELARMARPDRIRVCFFFDN